MVLEDHTRLFHLFKLVQLYNSKTKCLCCAIALLHNY